eukprot:726654-Prorocentrum_lima.AAC.1
MPGQAFEAVTWEWAGLGLSVNQAKTKVGMNHADIIDIPDDWLDNCHSELKVLGLVSRDTGGIGP